MFLTFIQPYEILSNAMKIFENLPLKPYNTFGVSVNGKKLYQIERSDDLSLLLDDIDHTSEKYLILGAGSNILFAGDYPGMLLHNSIYGLEVLDETGDDVFLRVGGGVVWNDLVNYCVDHSWHGIENLALIPGTVGAAPVQNIGAYGVELKDSFHSLEALNLSTGKTEEFDENRCNYSYRSSFFKSHNNYLITTVTFRLSKRPELDTSYGALEETLLKHHIRHPKVGDVRDAVVSIRQSKLPDHTVLGNAGSFFKNPLVSADRADELKSEYSGLPVFPVDNRHMKLSAAWLIDRCGWKGKRVGSCGVYEKHALILVNHGNATGKDILDLSCDIQRSVEDRFGVLLEPEVRIIKGEDSHA